MIVNVVISEVDRLTCVVLSGAEKDVCLMGDYSVQQNAQRYSRGVAQTEVVITGVNFI